MIGTLQAFENVTLALNPGDRQLTFSSLLSIKHLHVPYLHTMCEGLQFWSQTKLDKVPGDSDGKESACNAGDPGLTPGSEDLLEKGKATHSSILAGRTPRTENPGGLQSWGHKELDT